jgi:hypothetical protein
MCPETLASCAAALTEDVCCTATVGEDSSTPYREKIDHHGMQSDGMAHFSAFSCVSAKALKLTSTYPGVHALSYSHSSNMRNKCAFSRSFFPKFASAVLHWIICCTRSNGYYIFKHLFPTHMSNDNTANGRSTMVNWLHVSNIDFDF